MISFRVDGIPAPKGSTRAFVVKGRAIVTEANARTRPWSALVRDAAQSATGGTIVAPRGVSVRLEAVFTLPRPASLPKKVLYPAKKPDLDKCLRNALDALTGVVWHDDSQVVEITARKRYAAHTERPGVDITIHLLT